MNQETIRIGTRGSRLALAQTRLVANQLQRLHPGVKVKVVEVQTRGDQIRDRPLHRVGGQGLFVKELERALLEERVDLAVHSLKDLPSEMTPELGIAAVPPREDARDILVSAAAVPLSDLPSQARIGTSSLRRRAQLLAFRPDLQVVDIRGNVDTRLRKVAADDYHAVVLAAAGLIRLGLRDRITEIFAPEVVLPAVGQGALAVQIRSGDERVRSLVAPLNDPQSWTAVAAERGFLKRLQGGCKVPIAGYAIAEGQEVWLRGLVASRDGQQIIAGEKRGPAAEAASLGKTLAEELLASGAAEILDKIGRNPSE